MSKKPTKEKQNGLPKKDEKTRLKKAVPQNCCAHQRAQPNCRTYARRYQDVKHGVLPSYKGVAFAPPQLQRQKADCVRHQTRIFGPACGTSLRTMHGLPNRSLPTMGRKMHP